jgi:hypothetical protein
MPAAGSLRFSRAGRIVGSHTGQGQTHQGSAHLPGQGRSGAIVRLGDLRRQQMPVVRHRTWAGTPVVRNVAEPVPAAAFRIRDDAQLGLSRDVPNRLGRVSIGRY